MPVILETNLDSLKPSYIQDITIKGKVSKKPGQKAVVTVYVNDEHYSELANEDGTFSVNVKLERKISENMNEDDDYDPESRTSNYYASYGEGYTAAWHNNIKIIAKTESGLESEPIEDGITLATCGYGSWWSLQLNEPTPTILTPRLMLEGIAQIGIPISAIKWQGGSQNGTLNNVDATASVTLSAEDQKRYDLDWVQKVDYISSRDLKKGYVLISIKKLDSGSLFMDSDEAKEGKSEDELTTLEMENYLSDHRINDDCIVPGFGCIRIPIMIEIDFSYKNGSTTLVNNRRQIEMTKQRQCWDVEIPIDRRLPSDQLPEEFLKSSITLLNQSISAINDILKPLNTIKQVLFYSCAGSIVIEYAMAFQESYNCEFSEALNKFSDSGKKFDVYYAQTGQCEYYEDEESQKSACEQCETSIKSRKNFEKTRKLVCDRIFCPSAPTFQKYVKDMSDQYRASWDPKSNKIVPNEIISDCAYQLKGNEDKYMLYQDIFDVYEVYKEGKKSESEINEKCSELHPYDKDCCGYEYMQEWDSACLIGFDELKESKCLALEEQRNINENSDPDCTAFNKIWNSLAGFCEPDGTAPAEVVPANDQFKTSQAKEMIGLTRETDDKYIIISADTSLSVWFRFLPEKYISKAFGANKPTRKVYPAEIGYITTNTVGDDAAFEPGEDSRVSSQKVFRPMTKSAAGSYFYIDVSVSNPNDKDYELAQKKFVDQYVTVTGSSIAKAKQVYRSMQERIGFADKEYIVDPTSSILRSIQCVCLPGITSYLNLWKKVMEAVRLCFQTILVTGDGSAGICKAVLSVYVCDLIYDLISCFTQKYGPGTARDTKGGIGSLFGALTSAGEKISNSVAGRYGDSPIWKSLFAEKKLVHAICLWAFTGTWDFDVNEVLEEDVSIDVETVGIIYPCTRRFIYFNPASNPSGLTTYNYHLGVGLVAGSRIEYGVDLICSDDYSCNTPTGECDCVSIGKRTQRIVAGPGKVERGGVIDEEIYPTLKDAPYRYDKAIIKWKSFDSDKSGEVECKITDVGGNAPAFCQLDIGEGRYRCELDFSEENYIRFYNEPVPSEKEYISGQKVYVNVRVTQRMPEDAVNIGREITPYTKFLYFKMYNKNGVEVATSEYYAFNFNGMHEMTDLPGFTINKDDFCRAKASIRATGNVKSIELLNEQGAVVNEEVYIKFTDDNGNYEVLEEVTKDNTKVKQRISTSDSTGRTIDNMIFRDNYKIAVSQVPKAGQEIHVVYTPATISGDCCTSDLQRWKMHLTFYDKSPDTEDPSGQVSMYQDEAQERVIDIPVRCKSLIDTSLPQCTYGEKVISKCYCGSQSIICDPKQGINLTCTTEGGQAKCK